MNIQASEQKTPTQLHLHVCHVSYPWIFSSFVVVLFSFTMIWDKYVPMLVFNNQKIGGTILDWIGLEIMFVLISFSEFKYAHIETGWATYFASAAKTCSRTAACKSKGKVEHKKKYMSFFDALDQKKNRNIGELALVSICQSQAHANRNTHFGVNWSDWKYSM